MGRQIEKEERIRGGKIQADKRTADLGYIPLVPPRAILPFSALRSN